MGDYALTVAQKLRETGVGETTFAANETGASAAGGFELVALTDLAVKESFSSRFDRIILHYVNYGYQKRGVPFGLLHILRGLRRNSRGRFLTIFHELSASAPPWKSAFWLRPFQVRIAKEISQISDVCIVSNETTRAQLRKLTPAADISVHPVPSNFGEPSLSADQLDRRDAHRWVICGGNALLQRSVHSFRRIFDRIPNSVFPRHLAVLGGNNDDTVRSTLADLPNVEINYRPQIAAGDASRILADSSFSWIDYFYRPNVPTSVILKSGAFAAVCAHGVIPVFPDSGSAISLDNDELPGPFFINLTSSNVAPSGVKLGAKFYDWYQRHASSNHLVREITQALGLVSTEAVLPESKAITG